MDNVPRGEWADTGPPPVQRPTRPSRWDSEIDEMKARPGEWRRFFNEHRSAADRLQARAPELEVTTRDNRRAGTRRLCTIWARWPA